MRHRFKIQMKIKHRIVCKINYDSRKKTQNFQTRTSFWDSCALWKRNYNMYLMFFKSKLISYSQHHRVGIWLNLLCYQLFSFQISLQTLIGLQTIWFFQFRITQSLTLIHLLYLAYFFLSIYLSLHSFFLSSLSSLIS